MEQRTGNLTKEEHSYEKLSGSTLKLIAVFTMLIDHMGATVVYAYWNMATFTQTLTPAQLQQLGKLYTLMRQIGRTSFPIFCFLLCEGFSHTRSRAKYVLRLFLFALASELPFDLAFAQGWDWQHQNVFFTLTAGCLVLWGMETVRQKYQGFAGRQVLFNLLLLFGGALLADSMHMDYNINGILLIAIFYLLRESRLLAGIAGYLSFFWEAWCFPAFILIQFYNGKRGMRFKYGFYLFYPLHLFILYLVERMIFIS